MKKFTVEAISIIGGGLASFASVTGVQVGIIAMTACMKSVPGQIAVFTLGTVGNVIAGTAIQQCAENQIREMLSWNVKEEKKA